VYSQSTHEVSNDDKQARSRRIVDVVTPSPRRTAGCRWLQRDGKRIEEVSILLGHSSVQVTEQRYAFLEAERVAASLSRRTNVDTEPIRACEKAE
jgi:integrase